MSFDLVGAMGAGKITLEVVFAVTQCSYLFALLVLVYFYTRPKNIFELRGSARLGDAVPAILLLYPVLHEALETMRTTFNAIDKIDYPVGRSRIVAIPNFDDVETIDSLQQLKFEFPWLEILPVPATTDSSWDIVWRHWDENSKAYWWHEGKRAHVRDLPAKKTRQLVYAFYNLCSASGEDVLVSYIDADSAPPANYFQLGAAGSAQYDVIQLTNVAGNLLATWPSSFHAFDHVCWDSSIYPHMTANGKHPFYVLGKGLFFKSSNLFDFGGFHPWITIEDPEVGMRLWTNGCRLGVVLQPLVEEVPSTFRQGVTQRKRWVCGFFQSLGKPLSQMGMSATQRLRARLNLVPTLSLLINPLGIGVGIWILVLALTGGGPVDLPLEVLSGVNIVFTVAFLFYHWWRAWVVSKFSLNLRRSRLHYVLRVNPLFVLLYWLFWTIPIVIGYQMFVRDRGLTWERTVKIDANHDLVRTLTSGEAPRALQRPTSVRELGSGLEHDGTPAHEDDVRLEPLDRMSDGD
jgi:cellulose synthase/poly-beta-1,6-N-acetylglucosamine synthase-like glycosyltransferase